MTRSPTFHSPETSGPISNMVPASSSPRMGDAPAHEVPSLPWGDGAVGHHVLGIIPGERTRRDGVIAFPLDQVCTVDARCLDSAKMKIRAC